MIRALAIILAVAVLLAGAGVGGWMWLEKSRQAAIANLDARETYWTGALRAAVPVGASRDDVERWLATLPKSGPGEAAPYNPDLHAYVASPETVDAGGLRWPCPSWSITLTITMGVDGTVIRRDVSAGGSCS